MQYSTYASWQRRTLAFTIDQIVLAPFLIPLAFPERFRLSVLWTMTAVWFASTLICQGRGGRSIGRLITKTRLVDRWTNEPVGFWRMAVRNAVHVIDLVPLGLGFLWPVWDERRQTWADKIMNSVVLDEREATTTSRPERRHPDEFPALEPVA